MEFPTQNNRCIVCDLDTANLSALHKHQSTSHTAEELSLSLVTLQSFIYHKHYFQSLDTKALTNTCYFYPFCSQLFSEDRKNMDDNLKVFARYPSSIDQTVTDQCLDSSACKSTRTPETERKRLKIPMDLRLPHPTVQLPNFNSISPNLNPIAHCGTSDSVSHGSFLNSANALCDDLMKLESQSALSTKNVNLQSKVKRKRLEEKNRSRPIKRDNKQMVQKPKRKPVIPGHAEASAFPHSTVSHSLDTLKIWGSKSEETAAIGVDNNLGVPVADDDKQIKLNSPTVPVEMMNCENALVFNPDTGSFQWNPLVFVEKSESKELGNEGQERSYSGQPNLHQDFNRFKPY